MEYMLLRFEACYRERTRRGRVGRNADSKQHPSLWRVESIFEISMKFLQKKTLKTKLTPSRFSLRRINLLSA
jgi:hypothetical protein